MFEECLWLRIYGIEKLFKKIVRIVKKIFQKNLTLLFKHFEDAHFEAWDTSKGVYMASLKRLTDSALSLMWRRIQNR